MWPEKRIEDNEIRDLQKKVEKLQREIERKKELGRLRAREKTLKLELKDLEESQQARKLEPLALVVTSPIEGSQHHRDRELPIIWEFTGEIGEFLRIDILKRGFLLRPVEQRCSIELRERNLTIPADFPPGNDYQVRLMVRETGREVLSGKFKILT